MQSGSLGPCAVGAPLRPPTSRPRLPGHAPRARPFPELGAYRPSD